MNIEPICVSYVKSCTGTAGPCYNNESTLLVLTSRVNITIAANSGANIETGFCLKLRKEVFFELVPSRNTPWKDTAFIRRDIFTNIDTCPITVYVFNYSNSSLTINNGEELCWGKFSTYVKTTLAEHQPISVSESSDPVPCPPKIKYSTQTLDYPVQPMSEQYPWGV